jgi:hypothetical protein
VTDQEKPRSIVTSVSLWPADKILADELGQGLGLASFSDVVRVALRALKEQRDQQQAVNMLNAWAGAQGGWRR